MAEGQEFVDSVQKKSKDWDRCVREKGRYCWPDKLKTMRAWFYVKNCLAERTCLHDSTPLVRNIRCEKPDQKSHKLAMLVSKAIWVTF